jgi:hypothetical protein
MAPDTYDATLGSLVSRILGEVATQADPPNVLLLRVASMLEASPAIDAEQAAVAAAIGALPTHGARLMHAAAQLTAWHAASTRHLADRGHGVRTRATVRRAEAVAMLHAVRTPDNIAHCTGADAER